MIPYAKLKIGMEVEARATALYSAWVPGEIMSVERDAAGGMAMIDVRLFYSDGRQKTVAVRAWQLRLKPEGGGG